MNIHKEVTGITAYLILFVACVSIIGFCNNLLLKGGVLTTPLLLITVFISWNASGLEIMKYFVIKYNTSMWNASIS